MKQLRNIALDLVEKRLWPVALGLLAGMVAVPVLLGASPVVPPAPSPAPAAVGVSSAAQVALATADLPGGPERAGELRDPFGRKRAPKAALASLAPTPTGGTSVAPQGGTPGPDPGDGGFGPLPDLGDLPPLDLGPDDAAPAAPAAPQGEDLVTVRVGRTGQTVVRKDVEARVPLPSVGDPFLVFLGTKPDGATAQFLVSDVAVATGDGTCLPSPDQCEQVNLVAGMTQYFDVTGEDGEVVQYQLDVLRVGASDD